MYWKIENSVPGSQKVKKPFRKIQKACHHENKSVYRRPPYTPLLYSKTWVYRDIHFFS